MKVNMVNMNESLDLTKILKNCPQGYYFYTPLCGNVRFLRILPNGEIFVYNSIGNEFSFMKDGSYMKRGECLLFPSFDMRDWSKFTAPWYKKEKFDPYTLQPFDKVLVRDSSENFWKCDYFSHIDDTSIYKYCTSFYHNFCIPYNEETKYLVGTKDEAPEYYRYWEK